MPGESNVSEKTLKDVVRESNLWKYTRTVQTLQLLWIICALLLMVVMLSQPAAQDHTSLILAMGFAGLGAGAFLHLFRKPLPAHERMLGGTIGVVSCILISMGRRLLQLLLSPLLLGLSLAFTGAASLNDHLNRSMRFFGLSEEECTGLQREALKAVLLPVGIVMAFVLFILRMSFGFAACLCALTCSVLQIFAALNDPVDRRVLHKLQRYDLAADGRANGLPELRKWLQGRLVEKNHMPWGILFLEHLLMPFNRHTMKDFDRVKQDEDNPVIYLCNHGNFYGPIVGDLFLPKRPRIWVLSTMMQNMKETTDYVYTNTYSHVKWIPPFLRYPVAMLAAHVSHWGMRSIEGLPVYRDQPSKLINTFRATVEALQCGDSVLIFPENPHMDDEDHKGYVTEGVGDLYEGFAMVAPIYYRKTGKCCRFVPMFAHQESRTIAFGEEIVYDPTANPTAECHRLTEAAAREMNRLYRELEDAAQARHGRRAA